ncbi:hypothetical protein BV25DRAFT_1986646 [Artomyces pyxidatus]|uniref:Uncharacterized protein n=1 Tax=Artomyces pyxidatus TaxID=48021 RepID=A0ACB8TKZ1_9AGAM|nr:hypothetical protein BV25DRAFT_1986646 [Artomyces pyxidatus]
MSAQIASAKVTEQAAQGGVLLKLILFSLSLGIVPLSSYFLSEKYIWNGNSNLAAITAVVAANIVLVAYIVLSMFEDNEDQQKAARAKEESRKNR